VNETVSNQVRQIPIAALMPDLSQPRKSFPQEELQRFAASIKEVGVLQPLRVKWDEQCQMYVIVNGGTRYLAGKLVGLTELPCVVVDGIDDEVTTLTEQLIENVVRHDLNPIDEARALQRLKALKGCTSKALAEIGFSGAAITKAEALLKLALEVQDLVASGQLAGETAYMISRLPDEQEQRELAHAIVTQHLPRQAVAELVQAKVGKRNVRTPKGRVSCKLDGGVSVTVSTADALTWDGLLDALDSVRKQAKKLADKGDPVSALARVLRAS
jgi:ParB family transcriptional regulator, chromosome partitioning protein